MSTTSEAPSSRPLPIVAVLCFGTLTAALMQTLVLPIQLELSRLLHSDPSTSSWVVTATLLGAAVAMPIAGRLGDITGKQRVLVGSAGVLVIGSVVCALSDSVGPMIGGRFLQGIAMGFIPVAISMIREVMPPHRMAASIAILTATLGVGGAIGMPLAAWLVQSYDWHTLFGTSAALAAVQVVLTATVVPHRPPHRRASIDLTGAVGLAVGLAGVLVGVSKGNAWGWTAPPTLLSIVGGLAVLVVWGLFELHRAEPLVDLRTTARRPVLLTNIAAFLVGFGLMAQAIVLPQLLEMPRATGYGLGQSMLQTGLWTAPGGLTMMLLAPLAGRLMTSVGARSTLAIAASIIGVGYLVALFLMDAPWQLLIAGCISCAGVGMGYAAMPTLILENVPAAEAGAGVGINTVLRSVGTTTSGAVMAGLLTSNTITLAPGGAAIPSSGAFKLCFIVGAGAAFLAGAIAMSIRSGQAPSEPVQPPVDTLGAAGAPA